MTKKELQSTIATLVKLGEDVEELSYWERIYDSLQPDAQRKLDALLRDELKKLERAT